MFAKVYQYKFPGVSEAKVAASYCSDKLGKKIVEFDFEGLNIMIRMEIYQLLSSLNLQN